MNVYIITDVADLTSGYHSGGGLVAVAPDLPSAKSIVAAHCVNSLHDDGHDRYGACEFPAVTNDEWASAAVLPLDGDHPASVWIMPNAGCC